MLNFYSIGPSIQVFIGKEFLDRYLPGAVKGWLAFLLFILTISILDFVEVHSMQGITARDKKGAYCLRSIALSD